MERLGGGGGVPSSQAPGSGAGLGGGPGGLLPPGGFGPGPGAGPPLGLDLGPPPYGRGFLGPMMGGMGPGGMPPMGGMGPSMSRPPPPQMHVPQDAVMHDALVYLERVQQEFADRSDVYLTFLSIMHDFKAHKMDMPEVVSRVSQLFQGHDGLLRGFQTFLTSSVPSTAGMPQPPGRPPSARPPEPPMGMGPQGMQGMAGMGGQGISPDLKMADAIAYMDRVKDAYMDRQEVYLEFLDIIKGFQEGRISTPGVIAGVSKLFRGNDELLQGFNAFLPEGQRMPPPKSGGPGRPMPDGGDAMSLPPALQATSPSSTASNHPGGVGGPQANQSLQMTDAMAYMDRVRDTFQGQPDVYQEFLEVMRSFQSQAIGIQGVIEHVCRLFAGHDDLLLGFNMFLPEGHYMPVPGSMPHPGGPPPGEGLPGIDVRDLPVGPGRGGPPGFKGGPPMQDPNLRQPPPPSQQQQQQQQDMQLGDAMKYMDRVRELYAKRQDVYFRFLEVMKDFQAGRLDTPGVIAEVSHLFAGHEDLIQGFNNFLPEGHRMPVPGQGPGPGPMPPMPVTSTAPPPPPVQPAAAVRPKPFAPPQVATGSSPVLGARPGADVNYAVNFVAKVKQRMANDPERFKRFLEVLQHYESDRQDNQFLMATVTELFDGHPDLLQEFAVFLPSAEAQQEPSPQQQPQQPPTQPGAAGAAGPGAGAVEMDMNLAVQFLQKVKQRFAGDRAKYQQFLELLHAYERATLSPDGVMAQVSKLLAGHQDLAREFTYFLPQVSSVMGGAGGLIQQQQQQQQQQSQPPTSQSQGGPAASAPAPSSSSSSPPPDGSVITEDFAITFVNRVKTRFAHKPEHYQVFLSALQEYERNPHWSNTIIDVAHQLFGDHPDLLRDFSFFLPREQQRPPTGQSDDKLRDLQPGEEDEDVREDDDEEDYAEDEEAQDEETAGGDSVAARDVKEEEREGEGEGHRPTKQEDEEMRGEEPDEEEEEPRETAERTAEEERSQPEEPDEKAAGVKAEVEEGVAVEGGQGQDDAMEEEEEEGEIKEEEEGASEEQPQDRMSEGESASRANESGAEANGEGKEEEEEEGEVMEQETEPDRGATEREEDAMEEGEVEEGEVRGTKEEAECPTAGSPRESLPGVKEKPEDPDATATGDRKRPLSAMSTEEEEPGRDRPGPDKCVVGNGPPLEKRAREEGGQSSASAAASSSASSSSSSVNGQGP